MFAKTDLRIGGAKVRLVGGRGSRPGVQVQRERIVDAAARLLIKQGIETISVDALRKRAEVSRATFYRCFKNLDEVVAALYERMEDAVATRLVEMLPTERGRPEDWVPSIVERVFEDAHRGGALTVALSREEMRPGSPAKQHRKRRIDRQANSIAQWWTSDPDEDAIALAKSLVLLLQVAGMELALHPRMPMAKRDALQRSVTFMLVATVEKLEVEVR